MIKKLLVTIVLFNFLIWGIWFAFYLNFISPTLRTYTPPENFEDAAQERVYQELSAYYGNKSQFYFIDERRVFAAMMLKNPDLMESFSEYYRTNEAAFTNDKWDSKVWEFEAQFNDPAHTVWDKHNHDLMDYHQAEEPSAELDGVYLLWWNLSKRMITLNTWSDILVAVSLASLMIAHVNWIFFSQEKKKRRPIFLALYTLFNAPFCYAFYSGFSDSGLEYGLILIWPYILFLIPFHFAFKKSNALILVVLFCLYFLGYALLFYMLSNAY